MKYFILSLLLISSFVHNASACVSSCVADITINYLQDGTAVEVRSSKDISHVVITYCDGKSKKYDGLRGKYKKFEENRCIVSARVKSGCSTITLINDEDCCSSKSCEYKNPKEFISATPVFFDNVLCVNFVNKSLYCETEVGVAAYEKFDEIIDNQNIFDHQSHFFRLPSFVVRTISPFEKVELCVKIPDCAAQLDWFYGPVLLSLNGVRYGQRLFGAYHTNTHNNQLGGKVLPLPEHCKVPTPTPTPEPSPSPEPTPQPTPVVTPSPTPCPIVVVNVDKQKLLKNVKNLYKKVVPYYKKAIVCGKVNKSKYVKGQKVAVELLQLYTNIVNSIPDTVQTCDCVLLEFDAEYKQLQKIAKSLYRHAVKAQKGARTNCGNKTPPNKNTIKVRNSILKNIKRCPNSVEVCS